MYDCALFDIDGVLVDIRKSYNAAIKKTVEYMLKSITGKSFRGIVTDQIILKFRASGGFNNDTDTTYAITLATLAKQPKNVAQGRKFLMQVAGNADQTGYLSIEKFLATHGIEKWKGLLNYPSSIEDSMLARVFDELFYGPDLFRKQDHMEPKYWTGGRPFISYDRLDVSTKTMKRLNEMFDGNLALVSGRSLLAAEYSLRPVMKYFNLDACVFLEDEKREYAKPNPYAIRHAMEVMDANSAVYAGDSAEDLMMARRVEKEAGVKIAFVGVYGNSPNPTNTIANFKKGGVEAMIKRTDQLPVVISKKLK
jgi:phosphoglycolate phosphatase-like HAD superfamily hydrolase